VNYPSICGRSITWDRGSEMASWRLTAQRHGQAQQPLPAHHTPLNRATLHYHLMR
jgi:IS30 family transposase